ncbi:hypothetical protein QR46_4973 [Giardia duodenalis assemblage B]|uniref:Uncharacterized protein n=1 Tax=Giardia duodenalis assemblage B TaxID=1394984 RepID=A0A132NLY7_GIAIN|nr:hypothetical protein QR46_4973 [Giardia intestinalis assemblage B]
MNIRGSFLHLDTGVSGNSSGSLFAPPGPTVSVLPRECIQRHRDERGRAPGLLPAGPSAFSEVLYSICLASRPGSEPPLPTVNSASTGRTGGPVEGVHRAAAPSDRVAKAIGAGCSNT